MSANGSPLQSPAPRAPRAAPMGFGRAMVLYLRRFRDVTGRSRRAEYWWVVLAYLVAVFAILVLLDLATASWDISVMLLLAVVGVIAQFCFLPLLVSLTMRRLHDTGRSGGWVLLPLGAMALLALSVFGSGSSGEAAPPGDATLSLWKFFALLWLGTKAVLAALLILPSQPGANRYGPSPLEA